MEVEVSLHRPKIKRVNNYTSSNSKFTLHFCFFKIERNNPIHKTIACSLICSPNPSSISSDDKKFKEGRFINFTLAHTKKKNQSWWLLQTKHSRFEHFGSSIHNKGMVVWAWWVVDCVAYWRCKSSCGWCRSGDWMWW